MVGPCSLVDGPRIRREVIPARCSKSSHIYVTWIASSRRRGIVDQRFDGVRYSVADLLRAARAREAYVIWYKLDEPGKHRGKPVLV